MFLIFYFDRKLSLSFMANSHGQASINNLKAQPIAYKHNSGWMFIEYHAYAK
jgi:hypothetical protein